MAKEIVIWCECDLEQDKRVLAREYEITIDGVTRTLDLCDEHYQEHLAPLLKVLEHFGQPVVQKRGPYKKKNKATAEPERVQPTANGEYVCDYPGCGRAFNRSQGLGRHKTSHPDLEGFRQAASGASVAVQPQ